MIYLITYEVEDCLRVVSFNIYEDFKDFIKELKESNTKYTYSIIGNK